MRRRSLLLALGALPACSTGDLMRELRGGETREQVERLLGRPDGYQRQGNDEALIYSNRYTSGWDLEDKADYVVILTDGRVSSYGPGQVRPGARPQTLIVVPVTRR